MPGLCRAFFVLANRKFIVTDSNEKPHRGPYLLQELRCAAIRARLWQADIEAVGLALKGGLVTPEQALEMLRDCDCLQIVGIHEEAA
jgi:hypothetical protein